ncbi:unnamed protein product [Prorocentrum cordatum]|uniref:Uncharacterized protein n=1 Tax=Prorocentrum cordatum TaxID=2364126 RepID=A0ABN9QDV7_9DINO|nr:unnamed protein product [Polarella glacialis]
MQFEFGYGLTESGWMARESASFWICLGREGAPPKSTARGWPRRRWGAFLDTLARLRPHEDPLRSCRLAAARRRRPPAPEAPSRVLQGHPSGLRGAAAVGRRA